VGGLDVVIEVRTKLSGHRVLDKQRRADVIRERLSGLPLGQVGVWLILCEGAWSQSWPDQQRLLEAPETSNENQP
jgi:hypothetical protein